MIPCQRSLFDLPEDVAYFNCAYLSPQLNAVREAGYRGVDRKSRPWSVGPEDFFAESERVRELFARLIEAGPDDIAILPSVSYGVQIAVNNLRLRAGQEVVLLAEQFPSNVYPWLEAAKVQRARAVVVPRPPDGDWTAGVLEALTDRTAVVALPQVHWTDGSLVGLSEISRACRERGIPLVLDVTQSLGALPLSVKALRPAFLVAAAYKWLLGPYSLAFLYAAPAYHDGRPIEYNWLNRENSEDFAGLVHYRDRFQPGARRFDVGERSNFTLMPMAVAALEQIHAWGVPSIQETLVGITTRIAEEAEGFGLQAPPAARRAGHILGLRFPQGPPVGLLARLAQQNVYVSLRGDAMRISPHLYNNERDLERLLEVLKAAV